jgi:hypothetical protein
MEGLHLDVNGRKVPFVNVSEMDLAELRLLKQVSGMSPLEVEAARWTGDPDAWTGLILVSLRRVEPDVGVEDLDSLQLLSVIEGLLVEERKREEEAAAADDAGPPADAAGEAANDETGSGPSAAS